MGTDAQILANRYSQPKTPHLPKLTLPTECDFAKQTQFGVKPK
jgi:hypothetical protein